MLPNCFMRNQIIACTRFHWHAEPPWVTLVRAEQEHSQDPVAGGTPNQEPLRERQRQTAGGGAGSVAHPFEEHLSVARDVSETKSSARSLISSWVPVHSKAS